MTKATICDGCEKRIDKRCLELRETYRGVVIISQSDAEALHFHGLECIQKWLDVNATPGTSE